MKSKRVARHWCVKSWQRGWNLLYALIGVVCFVLQACWEIVAPRVLETDLWRASRWISTKKRGWKTWTRASKTIKRIKSAELIFVNNRRGHRRRRRLWQHCRDEFPFFRQVCPQPPKLLHSIKQDYSNFHFNASSSERRKWKCLDHQRTSYSFPTSKKKTHQFDPTLKNFHTCKIKKHIVAWKKQNIEFLTITIFSLAFHSTTILFPTPARGPPSIARFSNLSYPPQNCDRICVNRRSSIIIIIKIIITATTDIPLQPRIELDIRIRPSSTIEQKFASKCRLHTESTDCHFSISV